MILLFRAVAKLVKWVVIMAAYVALAVGKVVALLVVLAFLAGRAGIRRLRHGRDTDPDEEHSHEYEPGSRSYGRAMDSFDADWQWERDMRLAQRRASLSNGGPSPRPGGQTGLDR